MRRTKPDTRRLPHPTATILQLICLLQAFVLIGPAAAEPSVPPGDERSPGTVRVKDIGAGELLWRSPEGLIPLPVVDIDVELGVTGLMARGIVRQTFSNPASEVIEAVYVFPLPERAAVDAMEMIIGDRRLVAVIEEREEAKAVYERAKEEGRKAGLLEQERPNLFSISVANINPGEEVAVRLEYSEELSYRDGTFGLAFPLTFTPRYTPAAAGKGCETSEPGDEEASPARIGGPFVGPGSALVPRATIVVRIRPGLPLESVHSPSHRITVAQKEDVWHVRPAGEPVVADRDFVLSWRPLHDENPAGAIFVEERDGERYALLMLLPPTADSEAGWGLPTETLFIIDVSGSMAGPSIRQARAAILQALDSLRAGDTFNLLKFNNTHYAFRDRFVSAGGIDMAAARAWVEGLEADGGTEILPALIRGMEMMADADPWPVQRIILITDGAVGNEEAVSAAVARSLGAARLHIVGIGPAPNRFLMREVARFGRGACEFIVADSELGERMEAFLGRVDRPVMRDLSLDWDGAPPLESYPERLPDLHAGEPLFVSLKLSPAMRGARALLVGRLAEGEIGTDLKIAPNAPRGAGVATRWARAKVRSLLDGLHRGADPAQVRAAVIAVARRFNLVTRYTSLVAVEEYRTAEGTWTTLPVANSLPRGSRLRMGVLPQGGTAGPLILVIGFVLTCAGATLSWLWRLVR